MIPFLLTSLALAATTAQAAFDLYPSGAPYPYAVHAPAGSGAGSSQKKCAILFTHGSGSRADSLDQKTYTWDGTGMLVNKYDSGTKSGAYAAAAENYIVILPVMPTSTRQWIPADLIKVLDAVKSKYPVDESCIHTQGYSMGGKVTWFNAALYPGTFASLTASAGFNEYSGDQSTINDAQMETIIKANIGIKAFYGSNDDKQPANTAQPLFAKLSSMGDSAASLTEINGDHGTMSSSPWEQTSLWDWVKTQSKSGSSSSGSDSSSSTSAAATTSSAGSSASSTSVSAPALSRPTKNPKKNCSSKSRHRRRADLRRRTHRVGPLRIIEAS